MKNVAVFPGSFDPITKGHEQIIKRALPLFDTIYVALGVNTTKSYLFSEEQRAEWLHQVFANEPKIKVVTYTGLTVKLCQDLGANYILRGLRNTGDFVYEKNIAQMNAAMVGQVETIFLLTDPSLAAINASIVREIYKSGGDISTFIPNAITLTPPAIK